VAKLLGANHFMIARMAFQGRRTDDDFERMNRRNKQLNWDDYEWIRDHCTSCSDVGIEIGTGTDLKQDGIEFPGAIVFGVTSNMEDIEGKTIAEGRFISPDEVQRSALVCVLGSEIKDKFFPNGSALGKTLKVRGLPMTVVGIEESRARFLVTPSTGISTFRRRRICKFSVAAVCKFTDARRVAKPFSPRSRTRASRCAISTG